MASIAAYVEKHNSFSLVEYQILDHGCDDLVALLCQPPPAIHSSYSKSIHRECAAAMLSDQYRRTLARILCLLRGGRDDCHVQWS